MPIGRPSDSTRVGLFLACFFAAGAILTAYLPLWLADRGLDAALIGTVLGVASLARVAAVPVWGWTADRLGRHRASLAAAASVAAISAALLAPTRGAAAIAVLVVGGGVAAAALAPLCDAVTLAFSAAGRLDYGRTRAWGSVSYMLATAGAGALLGRFGTAVVPWLLAAGYGAAAGLTAAIPRPPTIAARRLAVAPLGRAFRAALAATALTQGSHAAYYAFASLHWRAAGISDATIGLLIAEGIVAEVALFVWGARLVDWLGPARLTGIAASACLLRWSLTAVTTAVPLLAAIQLLHAATFACQHLSNMLVLRTLPPPRAAFAQTILAAIGFSAPTGIMIWVVGQFYASAGGGVFLLMAGLGGAALLVTRFLPGGLAVRPRP
ncbi:MAG: MFS transporter [Acetobacteraceae bacterium]|nr:MFS transporter [Acetobacteraceae bacterium]